MKDNEIRMSEFIEKAEGLLTEMNASHQRNLVTHEMHEEQLKMYRSMVTDSINLNERRWNSMRQVLVAVAFFLVSSMFTGGIAIEKRATKDDVKKTLEGYTKSEYMYRGFCVITDEVYESFEEEGVMTHIESEEEKSKTRAKILKEVDPEYRTRSVKKQ